MDVLSKTRKELTLTTESSQSIFVKDVEKRHRDRTSQMKTSMSYSFVWLIADLKKLKLTLTSNVNISESKRILTLIFIKLISPSIYSYLKQIKLPQNHNKKTEFVQSHSKGIHLYVFRSSIINQWCVRRLCDFWISFSG